MPFICHLSWIFNFDKYYARYFQQACDFPLTFLFYLFTLHISRSDHFQAGKSLETYWNFIKLAAKRGQDWALVEKSSQIKCNVETQSELLDTLKNETLQQNQTATMNTHMNLMYSDFFGDRYICTWFMQHNAKE